MRTKAIVLGVGLAFLGILGVFVARNYRTNRLLGAERLRLAEQLHRARALAQANRQLTAEERGLGGMDKLRQSAERARQLQGQIQRDQLRLHNLDAAAASSDHPVDPVWPDHAEVLPAKNWADVGSKTPRDLLETFLWASANGETAKLAGLIGFQPNVKAQVQAMFDELPEAAKVEYGTPEKVIATMIAASMPTDLTAVSVETWPDGNYNVVKVRDELASGVQNDLNFRADPTADGWQLEVPGSLIRGFRNKLTGGR